MACGGRLCESQRRLYTPSGTSHNGVARVTREACNVCRMTTPIGTPTPVIHRTEPWHGVGFILRMVKGTDKADVQWPGMRLTRQESLGVLDPGKFPRAWPLPAERRRRTA
jgi:hypothetical protein